jgi:O-succinylbenzoate synthase
VLRIFKSNYELKPKSTLSSQAGQRARVGVLLKVEFDDQSLGFSDLHPWPELGDAPLEVHLKALRDCQQTVLTQQALNCAMTDAKARKLGKNLFENLPVAKNHFLVTAPLALSKESIEKAVKDGFDTVKIKVGRSPFEEARWISELVERLPVKLRLDFNACLSLEGFKKFVQELSVPARAAVEFVEDPLPWNLHDWFLASELLPLALDHEIFKMNFREVQNAAPFNVLILKPMRMSLEPLLSQMNHLKLKFVVTSSLDHPVGVAYAALVAHQLQAKIPENMLQSGCLSTHAYEENLFLSSFKTEGPFFIGTLGAGIGFDAQLAALKWDLLL